jgi:hypothetical protein
MSKECRVECKDTPAVRRSNSETHLHAHTTKHKDSKSSPRNAKGVKGVRGSAHISTRSVDDQTHVVRVSAKNALIASPLVSRSKDFRGGGLLLEVAIDSDEFAMVPLRGPSSSTLCVSMFRAFRFRHSLQRSISRTSSKSGEGMQFAGSPRVPCNAQRDVQTRFVHVVVSVFVVLVVIMMA